MQKSCGGCRAWVKWKHFKGLTPSDGLCELHDCRAKSDSICKDWKPIKLKRENVHKTL